MSAVGVEAAPDVARMQRDRMERLQAGMAGPGFDAMVLLGNSNVAYATGARWPLADPGRANLERPVAVVVAGDPTPHLFTSYRDEAVAQLGLPEDHLHGPTFLDFDEGVVTFAAVFSGLVPEAAKVAVDELTGAISRQHDVLFPGGAPRGADRIIGAAKLTKTPDEVGFLREALRITEVAAADVQASLAPGMAQTELTATFLQRVFEMGADANILDPIWQVMPARLEDGPWTTHGDVACPLLTSERELVEGDVLWVDTGISYAGFSSDFGRTWIVGREPSAHQREQHQRWRAIIDAVLAVTKAGATAYDLTTAARAASGRARPWMEHFYLGHGLGVDSAEMPFVGTDLGDEFDRTLVLQAGMVLVLEPLIWDDGECGYRSEEVLLITEDGYVSLTDYPYDPYGD